MVGLERAKEAAGRAAASLVTSGMRIGLGTGSTARWFITGVGEAVAGGLRVEAVATSEATARLARELGIPVVELDARGVDLAVDGADLIDPDLRLIKGRGGAQVREKVVAAAARRFIIVADRTKTAAQLHGPVPVEILAFGAGATLATLADCGATFAVRRDAAGQPLPSDTGNLLADGDFGPIGDPEGLAQRLDAIPGVVGHGLFLGMADRALVADETGAVQELQPSGPRTRGWGVREGA
jgi:ribose 5-phosphate isomerase A